MERARIVKQKAVELIREGRKPSALALAQELEFDEEDVHRCLNYLEKQKEVRTYRKDILGTEHRMVGVNR